MQEAVTSAQVGKVLTNVRWKRGCHSLPVRLCPAQVLIGLIWRHRVLDWTRVVPIVFSDRVSEAEPKFTSNFHEVAPPRYATTVPSPN